MATEVRASRDSTPRKRTDPNADARIEERAFRAWYAKAAKQLGLNPNPDAKEHHYDYRAAFRAGVSPPKPGEHWPSDFKTGGHPRTVIGGFNTKTGERVLGTPRAGSAAELEELGWDPKTAKQLAGKPEPTAKPEWAKGKDKAEEAFIAEGPSMRAQPKAPKRMGETPQQRRAVEGLMASRRAQEEDAELDPFVEDVKDVGLKLLSGTVMVPQAMVGFGDLFMNGKINRALKKAGFEPAEARRILQLYTSQRQKDADAAVSRAEGIPAKIKAALQNPKAAIGSAAESAPSMVAGGVGGRGLVAGTEFLAPAVAARLGSTLPAIGAGFGEGAIETGTQMADFIEQSPTGTATWEQRKAAALSGLYTGGLTLLGGRIAHDLGFPDIDTLLVAGRKNPALAATFLQKAKAILAAGGSEALLEELPQSISSKMLENIGNNKPIWEGVSDEGIMGAVTGGLVGTLGAGYQTGRGVGRAQPPAAAPPQAAPRVPSTAGAAGVAAQPAAVPLAAVGGQAAAQVPTPAQQVPPTQPPPPPAAAPMLQEPTVSQRPTTDLVGDQFIRPGDMATAQPPAIQAQQPVALGMVGQQQPAPQVSQPQIAQQQAAALQAVEPTAAPPPAAPGTLATVGENPEFARTAAEAVEPEPDYAAMGLVGPLENLAPEDQGPSQAGILGGMRQGLRQFGQAITGDTGAVETPDMEGMARRRPTDSLAVPLRERRRTQAGEVLSEWQRGMGHPNRRFHPFQPQRERSFRSLIVALQDGVNPPPDAQAVFAQMQASFPDEVAALTPRIQDGERPAMIELARLFKGTSEQQGRFEEPGHRRPSNYRRPTQVETPAETPAPAETTGTLATIGTIGQFGLPQGAAAEGSVRSWPQQVSRNYDTAGYRVMPEAMEPGQPIALSTMPGVGAGFNWGSFNQMRPDLAEAQRAQRAQPPPTTEAELAAAEAEAAAEDAAAAEDMADQEELGAEEAGAAPDLLRRARDTRRVFARRRSQARRGTLADVGEARAYEGEPEPPVLGGANTYEGEGGGAAPAAREVSPEMAELLARPSPPVQAEAPPSEPSGDEIEARKAVIGALLATGKSEKDAAAAFAGFQKTTNAGKQPFNIWATDQGQLKPMPIGRDIPNARVVATLQPQARPTAEAQPQAAPAKIEPVVPEEQSWQGPGRLRSRIETEVLPTLEKIGKPIKAKRLVDILENKDRELKLLLPGPNGVVEAIKINSPEMSYSGLGDWLNQKRQAGATITPAELREAIDKYRMPLIEARYESGDYATSESMPARWTEYVADGPRKNPFAIVLKLPEVAADPVKPVEFEVTGMTRKEDGSVRSGRSGPFVEMTIRHRDPQTRRRKTTTIRDYSEYWGNPELRLNRYMKAAADADAAIARMRAHIEANIQDPITRANAIDYLPTGSVVDEAPRDVHIPSWWADGVPEIPAEDSATMMNAIEEWKRAARGSGGLRRVQMAKRKLDERISHLQTLLAQAGGPPLTQTDLDQIQNAADPTNDISIWDATRSIREQTQDRLPYDEVRRLEADISTLMDANENVRSTSGGVEMNNQWFETVEEARKSLEEDVTSEAEQAANYAAGQRNFRERVHFPDEANVVVETRGDERLMNGERTLVSAEHQSDLHKAATKSELAPTSGSELPPRDPKTLRRVKKPKLGYRSKEAVAAGEALTDQVIAIEEEAVKGVNALFETLNGIEGANPLMPAQTKFGDSEAQTALQMAQAYARPAIRRLAEDGAITPEQETALTADLDRVNELRTGLEQVGGMHADLGLDRGVPDLPYKDLDYVALSVRRVLGEAIDRGIMAVSVATAQGQADRNSREVIKHGLTSVTRRPGRGGPRPEIVVGSASDPAAQSSGIIGRTISEKDLDTIESLIQKNGTAQQYRDFIKWVDGGDISPANEPGTPTPEPAPDLEPKLPTPPHRDPNDPNSSREWDPAIRPDRSPLEVLEETEPEEEVEQWYVMRPGETLTRSGGHYRRGPFDSEREAQEALDELNPPYRPYEVNRWKIVDEDGEDVGDISEADDDDHFINEGEAEDYADRDWYKIVDAEGNRITDTEYYDSSRLARQAAAQIPGATVAETKFTVETGDSKWKIINTSNWDDYGDDLFDDEDEAQDAIDNDSDLHYSVDSRDESPGERDVYRIYDNQHDRYLETYYDRDDADDALEEMRYQWVEDNGGVPREIWDTYQEEHKEWQKRVYVRQNAPSNPLPGPNEFVFDPPLQDSTAGYINIYDKKQMDELRKILGPFGIDVDQHKLPVDNYRVEPATHTPEEYEALGVRVQETLESAGTAAKDEEAAWAAYEKFAETPGRDQAMTEQLESAFYEAQRKKRELRERLLSLQAEYKDAKTVNTLYQNDINKADGKGDRKGSFASLAAAEAKKKSLEDLRENQQPWFRLNQRFIDHVRRYGFPIMTVPLAAALGTAAGDDDDDEDKDQKTPARQRELVH